MKKYSTYKLALAGIFTAVAVVGSTFTIPIFAAKCSPVQHIVNVLAGVMLGPTYAVMMAFIASILRNLLGLGTLLAFPGSMIGALLCGVFYKLCPKLPSAYIGEVFGTGVLGAILSYPIAAFLMNNSEAALFTYIPSFMASTAVGALISILALSALKRTGAFNNLENSLR